MLALVKDVVLIGSFALVVTTQRTLFALTDHVSRK
ncbi:hypothetical protein PMIT1320_02104 [Prochlorococcus marinus str. MIT 1320]|nr:hypothetical protein PMIT1320_02104 [Prochlorococcus marinus str. MIT 1320]